MHIWPGQDVEELIKPRLHSRQTQQNVHYRARHDSKRHILDSALNTKEDQEAEASEA